MLGMGYGWFRSRSDKVQEGSNLKTILSLTLVDVKLVLYPVSNYLKLVIFHQDIKIFFSRHQFFTIYYPVIKYCY